MCARTKVFRVECFEGVKRYFIEASVLAVGKLSDCIMEFAPRDGQVKIRHQATLFDPIGDLPGHWPLILIDFG